MKTIALLPMKAHSERVSGKNFKPFLGKPLFRWILDELLSLDEIDQVVINTDAVDILRNNGLSSGGRVLVRERRPDIRGDFVSMNRIIEDDLATTGADLYLQTHTTNPLMTASTVRGCIAAYHDALKAGRDSLFTVTAHQSRFYWQDGRPVNHDPTKLLRTQDLPPLYEENSNLYLFTKASFARTKARIGATPHLHPIPRLEAVDIDDAETWMLAEAVGRAMGRGT